LNYNTSKEEKDIVNFLLKKYGLKRRESISELAKDIMSKIRDRDIIIENF